MANFRLLFFLLIPLWATAAEPRRSSINELVVAATRAMPNEGGYSASATSSRLLGEAIRVTSTGLVVDSQRAVPSFCSSATYLVFLDVISRLNRRGDLAVSPETLKALRVQGQKDGEGVWGRWNANGPGTARLFRELGLGSNFTNYADAKPGDFMKIFWTSEIGMRERGHSVVFMGIEMVDGVESVRFWSSNQPSGYGEKVVPRSKIALALFSRLESPAKLAGVVALKKTDPYLASMLSKGSSLSEMGDKCGF